MGGHADPDGAARELDALLSRANALEAAAADGQQRAAAGVLRALAEAQAHTAREIGHLKKAIDLLTLEMFKARGGPAAG